MKSSMMKMTAAAALVLGMASAAHAAPTDAQVTIAGAVSTYTCDVALNGSNTLDVGVQTPGDVEALIAGDGTSRLLGLNPKTEVKLSGCMTPAAAGNATLIFTGAMAPDASPTQTNAAWGDASKSVGYGFGMAVTPKGGNQQTAQAVDFNHDSVVLDTAMTTGTDLNDLSAEIEPYMMRTAAAVVAGSNLNVPVVISYVHN